MFTPQLVGLLGAECTGKTALARALALHFGGLWVPEYLRLFCRQHGRPPHVDEQALVMRRQFEQEEFTLVQARQLGCDYVFCDTTPLQTAIYSEFYFADTAMYAIKEKGRDGWQFFNESLQEKARQRLNITNGLRSAIEHHELSVRFQPIVADRLSLCQLLCSK